MQDSRITLLALVPFIFFAPPLPGGTKPLTPQEALASFHLESDDLEVTLVAGEPQVVDPVALCFDDKGRLYVVESRGYPHPGKGLPATREGSIAMLEDLDGDGLYEKRTTFAKGLTFPNGILAWKDGFFVTDAPEVLYLEDTDRDGVADQRKVILTGFGTNSSSEQLRVAAPRLGPDGWVYLTSGLTGSKVTSPVYPDRLPVETKRNDGRFHPSTFEYQGLNGAGQFGQAFDNHGRRFICDNRHPLQWVVFEPGVLARNPHLTGAKSVMDLVFPGSATPLYPLSPDTTASSYIPKLMQNLHAGTFTSSCGLCFFTGNALPLHRGNFFICEPAQNLVHCRVIEETQAILGSRSSTKGREFMASTDQWFRPVFASNGPDGALYLCDMYRKFVDHPNYLPKEAHANMDFTAGKQHGRIWKITSRKKASSKALPSLQGVSSSIRRAVELSPSQKSDKIPALAALAAQAGGNAWFRAAAFSSCPGEVNALLAAVPNTVEPIFLEDAAAIAAKEISATELTDFAEKILTLQRGWSLPQRFAFLLGLGPQARKPFDEKLQSKAVDASGNAKLSVRDRLLAIRFLNKGNRSHLLSLLSASVASDLRQAAIRSLVETEDLSIARKLLSKHASVGPETRNILSNALVSRKSYHPMILQSLEDGHLPVHAFSLNQRQRLAKSAAVKERAKKLFGTHEKSDRMKVYHEHKSILAMAADPSAGKPVYQRSCANCHRLGELGHAVGPDLTGLRNQPEKALLLHILVPNHEVYPAFVAYQVETIDGQSYLGVLESEDADSITLILPLGKRETIDRVKLKSLKASKSSLMPDGLEQVMSPQELADLLAFLKN